MRRLQIALLLIASLLAGCPGSSQHKPPAPPAPSSPAPDARAQMVSDLASLHFERLGNPVLRWDHIPRVEASRDRPHQLLVVMVEFPDRGFDRFAGEPDQASKLAAWYQELLFDDDYRRADTLSHYYEQQSLGAYHVTGKVLPPVKVSRPRATYGAPMRPAGGAWRNDADPEGLVEEALGLAAAAHPEVDWADFDRWDPEDFDGDGQVDEPDGYVDHFVLVFAGGGQASCNRLHKLDDVFTPNAGPEVVETLDARARECAERLWPHRFSVQKREGEGPTVNGRTNPLGGAPLSDGLWVRVYNMQSEYIAQSTFIHEFAHSIGLPDVYSRTSSNSTGVWEVMSQTAEPSPQSLSSWTRLMAGWLKPEVFVPPEFGGEQTASFYLRTLDEPMEDHSEGTGDGAARAALIALPPKQVEIDLGGLPPESGKWALYSGQGNAMNRTAELRVDLTGASGRPVQLSFDAWWEIEGGWDFAYLETSADGGRTWQRRVPVDRHFMPAKHGHDGNGTLPGFTGLSGDLDGDGKNESNPACDPTAPLSHGEDKAADQRSPCLDPTWVRPTFDLSDLAGKQARIRLRYFTDFASVMRGILIDNVALTGASVAGDFETEVSAPWHLDGFTRSTGSHHILVPQFYLLEYRDPYAPSAPGNHRYDSAIADPYYGFIYDPAARAMTAVEVRARPGVLLWYFDGTYAWGENDPADNGPGHGYLLAVDANPNEVDIPGFSGLLEGDSSKYDTHYEVSSADTQALLEESFFRTTCFVRRPSYRPAPAPGAPDCSASPAAVGSISVGGKPFMYSYEVVNELLPGKARDAVESASELVDDKVRDGVRSYRMRDASLRYLHLLDAPFALEPFADGLITYRVTDHGLEKTGARAYPAVSEFSDANPSRWLNPRLPFDGVAVPQTEFSFRLEKPPADAPVGARVKVVVSWKE